MKQCQKFSKVKNQRFIIGKILTAKIYPVPVRLGRFEMPKTSFNCAIKTWIEAPVVKPATSLKRQLDSFNKINKNFQPDQKNKW